MTGPVTTAIRPLASGAPCFHIALDAPRSNALEPGLLAGLHAALDALEASGARVALLTGGRNFSTGGDVARFHDAARTGTAAAYADEVVPRLQDCVSRMVAMPVLFATAARGAITGGSAGLLFASDLTVLAPDAFVQPYYATVGFAPDGGWTALLPERIGAAAAQQWLMLDGRHGADDLHRMGLATAIDTAPETRALDLLNTLNLDAAITTKGLIWDAARRAALRDRLAAETTAFRARIALETTQAGMARFLGREQETPHV
ncbi:enoyl-CoA hydratase/isomerase family protein [Pukyongiella litopenaei]|uniref:Enoyl-CoA hydratase/isomerase family protein n=1 Tax=Pukyongiella litopenaei TaxID=2605946 RepID=A0A2S0MKR1_9RHOB|nr:enoyl-CoA hydratase/isomerase family protein [Pukyongiella litopenaei]AVO36478.1 enoyl-CoA hydratase/isomerase family protein [Pukyongiella litopenaei]